MKFKIDVAQQRYGRETILHGFPAGESRQLSKKKPPLSREVLIMDVT
jgi:hypothetical protein